MDGIKLVIVAPPEAPVLKLFDRLPPEVERTIGSDVQSLAPAISEATVVVNTIGNGAVLAELWPLAKRLRWVHSLSAGVENQLFPEFVESPVPLTNARGVYKESLGEFVLAAILFFAKDLRRMLRNQQASRWEQFDVDVIYRQSVGILGYGEIGRAAASRAKALGMRVNAVRRRPELSANDPIIDQAYPMDARLEMIAASDYIVVASALTPETRGLVGEPELSAMKRSAVIINVGRGPIINEAALIQALEQSRIRGAALDVFDTEPLPPGHPFWRLENVLLSPHCADHIEGWIESSVDFFFENLERFSKGEPLRNIVDKRAGY